MRLPSWVIVSCILAVLVVGGLGAYFLRANSIQAGYQAEDDKEIALARKDGLALEPLDIAPNPPIKDADNAAPLYEDAARQLDTVTTEQKAEGRDWTAASRLPASAKEAVKEREDLRPLAQVVSVAERAAARPSCYFERDYSQAMFMDFPELAAMKSLARIECIEAQLDAVAGNGTSAIQHLRVARRIELHVERGNLLLGTLVGMSVNVMIVRGLSHVLEHDNSRATLSAARDLADSLHVPNVRDSLGAEIVFDRMCLRKLPSLSDDKLKVAFGFAGPDAISRAKAAAARAQSLAALWDAGIIHGKRTFFEALPADPTEWKAVERAVSNADAYDRRGGVSGQYDAITAPIHRGSCQAMVSNAVLARMARLGVRLLLKKESDGSLPATLRSYGKLGIDPYTGRPYHYITEGSGFKLYSTGADGLGDGGKHNENLVFEVKG